MVDISGRKDAIAIAQRYQAALNEAHGRVHNKRNFLYEMNHKLKWAMSETERLQKDVVANEEERRSLYESLQNLLKKETDFEDQMWKTTQKGRNVKSVTIKQKVKDSDVESHYGDMLDYLKQYPQYASKSSFSRILQKIEDIEAGIKHTKKELHKAMSDASRELAYFPRNIEEAKNNIKAYYKIQKEGEEKLKSMRYVKSFLYKWTSETRKLRVQVDTLNHKIDQYEETIKGLETEVKQATNTLTALEAKFGK